MTMTLERSRAPQRSAPAVRRSFSLVDRFEQLTDGYPFFGTVVGKRRYIIPGCIQNVALWIATNFPTAPLTDEKVMQKLLNTCQAVHPLWFADATALQLERPSRELQAGINVFRLTRNFAQIPDKNVPQSVVESYTEAIMRDPDRHRSFWYFEPIFNASTGTLVPTTIREFNMMLNGQREAIIRMVPQIRRALFIERFADPAIERITDYACIAAVLPMLIAWKALSTTFDILSRVPIFSILDIRQYAEMRERHEMYTSGTHHPAGRRAQMTFEEALQTLTRSPFARMSTAELDRIVRLYDPIIAFSLRNLHRTSLRRDFNGEPLALVSHW